MQHPGGAGQRQQHQCWHPGDRILKVVSVQRCWSSWEELNGGIMLKYRNQFPTVRLQQKGSIFKTDVFNPEDDTRNRLQSQAKPRQELVQRRGASDSPLCVCGGQLKLFELRERVKLLVDSDGFLEYAGRRFSVEDLIQMSAVSCDLCHRSIREGIKLLEKSLQMQRSLHGDRAHPGIAATLQKLGDLTAQSGDLKQAIKFLQDSLQMQRSLHGECDHPGIATTLHKLGDLTAQSGDLERGIQLLEESLRMQQSLHGNREHLGIAITFYKLGDVASRAGHFVQAIDCFELSLEMQLSLHGDRAHPGIAATLQKLGDVMTQTGDVTQAMRYLQESAEVNRSLYGEKDHPNVADVLHSLGTANQRAGDLEQAEKFLEQSLRMKQSLFDKKHPSLRATWNLLGEIRMTALMLRAT
eukprot:s266_g43.t1